MSRIQDCCFETYDPCYYAASNGHLECLRYAHEHGCPWDRSTCSWAASNGHLECLRYAHENGCPWGENTCYWAACYGQLECLRYAYEHGCPWDENTFHEAVSNGNFECLKYLIAHEWKTWKELKPQIAPRDRQSILNNNSWTVSNYIFLVGMIQSSSYIYKHFYNHSLFDLNLINDILSLL